MNFHRRARPGIALSRYVFYLNKYSLIIDNHTYPRRHICDGWENVWLFQFHRKTLANMTVQGKRTQFWTLYAEDYHNPQHTLSLCCKVSQCFYLLIFVRSAHEIRSSIPFAADERRHLPFHLLSSSFLCIYHFRSTRTVLSAQHILCHLKNVQWLLLRVTHSPKYRYIVAFNRAILLPYKLPRAARTVPNCTSASAQKRFSTQRVTSRRETDRGIFRISSSL